MTEKLTSLRDNQINFVETVAVKDGVDCDIYEFVGDDSKDLAIVRVASGSNTPLQRILKGDSTIEGYISGKGNFTVTSEAGELRTYQFPREDGVTEFILQLGQTMQWCAAENSDLVFYEICEPPFEDGRFENLSD